MKCIKGKPIHTTEGSQTREFNYVDNIVDGFITAAMAETLPGLVLNLGSGEEISVKDLVKKIHQKTDSHSELKIGKLPNRPTEIWRMSAETDLAKKNFDWTPKVNFEDGLVRTIAWYRQYLKAFYDKESILHSL